MGRDKKIDILKGIAIYLVVIGHVVVWFFQDFLSNLDLLPINVLVLWKFIYSFHMPLFIFLSGYVFLNPQKKYGIKHIIKRCTTYMIPFFTMGLLLYIWRGGKFDNYWYFRSLVEFSLLLFFIYNVVLKKIHFYKYTPYICLFLFIFIILIASHLIKKSSFLNMIFDISHLKLGVYFVFGWIYRIYREKVDRYIVNQFVLIVSLLYVFVCVVYNINIVYIRSIITILLFLNIAEILVNRFNCTHLEEVGKETMGIYIFHFFFTFKLFVIGNFLSGISNQGLSTSLVVQLAIVLPISYVIVKCCMYIIRFIKAGSITSLICLGDLNLGKIK